VHVLDNFAPAAEVSLLDCWEIEHCASDVFPKEEILELDKPLL
jgi:hypothetical protein